MAEKLLIVNICDRCNHEERAGTKKTLPKDWMKVGKDIDLCPECTESFNNWMNQPKNVALENQAAEANGVALNITPGPGVDPNPTLIASHVARSNLGLV